MIHCIIISHGNLAEEMYNSSKMILGEVTNIKYFGLQTDQSVDAYKDEIRSYLRCSNDELVVFCDLLGGSPMMTLLSLINEFERDITLITGMNLPMIIEFLMKRENIQSVSELYQIAETGKSGIKLVNKEVLNGG